MILFRVFFARGCKGPALHYLRDSFERYGSRCAPVLNSRSELPLIAIDWLDAGRISGKPIIMAQLIKLCITELGPVAGEK
jgi:hypothetical protein